MRKIKIGISVFVIALAISGAIFAATSSQVGQRVYVFTGNPIVKTISGVRHEFPGAFSTEVSPQIKILRSLGLVRTEPVQIFKITGKPVCGDGILHPSEDCEAPDYSCPEGQVCEDCKCVTPETRTCTPTNQYPWGIVKVNGGSGGAGVKVAVLDTGVYKDHLDLKANIIDCKDTTKRGIKNGCADGNGHGTHVSGTILANGGADGLGIFGVAPEAKLMAIKVCGNGGICWGDDIAAGIRYVADNGTNIISMSLGGDNPDSQILSAIDYAVDKGVLVVAAAGNDGPEDGSIDYPGAYVKVIAVGAIDSTEMVPDWSSRGINDGDYVIEEKEVEFGAPGVNVESTWNDGCYNTISGTSMSTPHVSGLAAKLWQGNATDTRSYLHTIAKDIWTAGDDTATGFGLPIAP